MTMSDGSRKTENPGSQDFVLVGPNQTDMYEDESPPVSAAAGGSILDIAPTLCQAEMQLARSHGNDMEEKASNCRRLLDETQGLAALVISISDWTKTKSDSEYTVALDAMNDYQLDTAAFGRKVVEAMGHVGSYQKTLENLFKLVTKVYQNNSSTKWTTAPFKVQLKLLRECLDLVESMERDIAEMQKAVEDRAGPQKKIQKLRAKLNCVDFESLADQLRKVTEGTGNLVDRIMLEGVQLAADISQAELDVEEAESKEKDARTELFEVTQHWEGLKARFHEVQQVGNLTEEVQREKMQKLLLDSDIERKQIEDKHQQKLQQLRADRRSRCVKLVDFANSLDWDALQIEEHDSTVNHAIFCVDCSASMRGSRWQSVIAAVEAFRHSRLQRGAMDRVTLIAFNYQASVIIENRDLSTDLVSPLKAMSPNWHTKFQPAWELISRCAERGPPNSRLLVTFVTDGHSGDIPAACQEAAKLHQKAAEMITIVVNVDKEVSAAALEPLVQAGNGGRRRLEKGCQSFQFLQNVASQQLVHNFKVIAALPLSQKEGLMARAEAARSQVETVQKSYDQLERDAESEHKDEVSAFEQRVKELNDGLGQEVVRAPKIISNQTERFEKDIKLAKTRKDQASDKLTVCKKTLADRKHKLESLRKKRDDLEGDSQSKQAMVDKVLQTRAAQRTKLSETLAAGVDQLDFSDKQTVQQQVTELDTFQNKYNANAKLMLVTHQFLNQTRSLGSFLLERLEDPTQGFEDTLGDAAIYRYLLENRRINFTGNADSSENMRLYLEYEARVIGVKDEDEIDEVVQPICSALLTSDICTTANCSDEEFEQRLDSLVEKVTQQVLSDEKVSDSEVKGKVLKEAKERVQQTTKEIKEVERKKNKLTSESDIDEAEDKLEKLQEERDTAQSIIDEAKEAAAERTEALNKYKRTFQLVRRVGTQTAAAFRSECDAKRVQDVLQEMSNMVNQSRQSVSTFGCLANFEAIQRKKMPPALGYGPGELSITYAAAGGA